jgi:hypothetical protein
MKGDPTLRLAPCFSLRAILLTKQYHIKINVSPETPVNRFPMNRH